MSVRVAARHLGRGVFHALAELGGVRMAPPSDARASAHRLAGVLGVLARAHDLVVNVRGEIPRGRALVVANQVGCFDLLAVLPLCPAIPIVPYRVGRWPILGPLAHAFDVVLAGPNGAPALRRVHALLLAGTPVLDFAARDADGVGPFARGPFGIAARLGAPIVPLALRYAQPDVRYLHAIRNARIEVALRFGAPLLARRGETPERLADRARDAVRELLEIPTPLRALAARR